MDFVGSARSPDEEWLYGKKDFLAEPSRQPRNGGFSLRDTATMFRLSDRFFQAREPLFGGGAYPYEPTAEEKVKEAQEVAWGASLRDLIANVTSARLGNATAAKTSAPTPAPTRAPAVSAADKYSSWQRFAAPSLGLWRPPPVP